MFRAGVDIIQLDVSVLDKDRRPVRGLTAADFTVLEDGRPARVVALRSIELPAPTLPKTPWLREVAPDVVANATDTRRIMVILFDDAHTGVNYSATSGKFRDPWILQTGTRIGRDVIDGLGPNDLAAVTFTYLGRKQNFTSDRAKLLRSIATYVPQSGSDGPPMACAFRGRVNCVYDAFESVIDALPTLPPIRKAIVYITQGGGTLPFSVEGLSRDDRTTSNRDTPTPTLGEFQSLFRKLQEANATIYAFSPGGVQIVNNRTGDSLGVMAESTGGLAVAGTNRPWEGVPAILAETSAYYILGVQTVQHDGRFHQVKVKVNRKDVEARTRIGYYAPLPEGLDGRKAPVGRPVDLALSPGFPKGDLPLASSTAAFAIPGTRRALVTIVTGVQSDTNESRPYSLELVAAAFDKEWKPIPPSRQIVQVTPTAGAPYAEVQSRLELDPGRYEVRIAGDALGRTGSVFLDVEVPDYTREPFSTSGLVLTSVPFAEPGGTALDRSRLQPTVRRTFLVNERVTAILQLYQPAASPARPVLVHSIIVDDSGRTVFERTDSVGVSQFDQTHAATFAFDLPLAQLVAGEHLLTISSALDERQTTSQVRFRVRP